jgi:hypothetical protein
MKRASERQEVSRLTDELFRAVELPQGYFHISDGETFATKAEFFERIRGRLRHGRAAVHAMEAFLDKYSERDPHEDIIYRAVEAENGQWFLWRGVPIVDTGDGDVAWDMIAPIDILPQAWRPMDTAPRNGTEILLRVKLRAGMSGCMLVGHFMQGGHCIEDHPPIPQGWYFWDGSMFDRAAEPEAWLPLPAESKAL